MTAATDKPGIPLLTRARAACRYCRRSLQFKASLLVVLVILAVVGGGTWMSLRATSAALFEHEFETTREWAASLASSAAEEVTDIDTTALRHTLSTLVRTRTVAYAAFADPTGKVIASTESEPGILVWAKRDDGNQLRLELLESPKLVRYAPKDRLCVAVLVPVYAPPAPGQSRLVRPIVGYLELASDLSQARARLAQVGNQLLRTAIGIVLLMVPCSLLLTRHIVHPLNALTEVARSIAAGSMNARAQVDSHDEIGHLAVAFNVMANRIMQSRMELLQLNAELEARVQERTQELEKLASKDPLTGLYNRRYFGEVIHKEFATAQRYGDDLTCLMLDLDRFKQINDQFGHRAGDDVLVLLARSITSQLRGADVAARFGGDEFILLLPQTSVADGSVLADRVVREFTVAARQSFPQLPASLSVGVASLNKTRAASPEALIHEADLALYAAKAHGRGCLVEAPAPTERVVQTVN